MPASAALFAGTMMSKWVSEASIPHKAGTISFYTEVGKRPLCLWGNPPFKRMWQPVVYLSTDRSSSAQMEHGSRMSW